MESPKMNKSTHYLAILGGAIVLVSGVTASPGAQKYSEWSTPINLGPQREFVRNGPGTGDL